MLLISCTICEILFWWFKCHFNVPSVLSHVPKKGTFCFWKILFYKLKIGRWSFQNKSNTKEAAQHFSMQFGILSKCWKNIITLIISSTKSLSRVRPFRKICFTVPVWTRSSSVYPSALCTVQHPQVTSYQPVNRHTATVMLTLYAAAFS